MSSFCAHYNAGHCRSCVRIEQPYVEQLVAKETRLREALAFFPALTLEPTIGSSLQGFRNRAKLSVTGAVEAPVIGLLGETALDQGRELLACPIHHPKLNALMAELPAWIRNYRLTPYRIDARQGELKGLIAFHSPASGETYLRFVLRSPESLARLRKMLPDFQKRFPEVTCVSANLQPIPHAILEGPEEIMLTEKDFIEHEIGPVRLRLAPQAFVQTNVEVATELYATAARWIAEAGAERMVELFCGQGVFSFFAAALPGTNLNEALGIEINARAVSAANDTAARLHLSSLKFKCADARQAGDELAEFRPELVLVNPPRRGLGKDGVRLLAEQRPAHLLYSSCAVETLADDLRGLAPHYRFRRAQIFDLFPHTDHFETLVWLERLC